MWLMHRGHMLLKMERVQEARTSFTDAKAAFETDPNKNDGFVTESKVACAAWLKICDKIEENASQTAGPE